MKTLSRSKRSRGIIGGSLIAAMLVLGQDAGAVLYGDANYIGEIVNGAPASAADEVGYINFLTTIAAGTVGPVLNPDPTDSEMYNRVDSTLAAAFPAATTAGGQNGLPPSATVDASGFQYLLGKYGGYTWVWYSETGFSATETLPGAPPSSDELSHISMYNGISVPDAGASLILLGAGLCGLGLVRRRVDK